ncbi:hypothetical protein GOBAR_AA15055 [Gossypium barbadense]|uniref:Uncharacterized protein n=1 Tax=Gossypium barbadense TaxID=3634 RepID=A0A2P5XQG0_GOSBA|nr:hypothetical protein GOBAR_AA15055 [Gossypium barbadense]
MNYHEGVTFNNHIWEIKSQAQVDRMKTSNGLNCKSRRYMFTNHHVQSQYSPMVISDNNSSAGCPERGMKSRIRVDFQTVFVQGSPPLIPNRAPKKLHLCHIQFRKHASKSSLGQVMCRSTQIPVTEGQSQKMCSKVSIAAKHQSIVVGCTD